MLFLTHMDIGHCFLQNHQGHTPYMPFPIIPVQSYQFENSKNSCAKVSMENFQKLSGIFSAPLQP